MPPVTSSRKARQAAAWLGRSHPVAARVWAIRWNSPLPWSTASIPANSRMHPHIFTVAEEASPTERMRAPARSSGGEGGGSWGTGLPSPVRRPSSSPERVTAPKSSQPSRRLPQQAPPHKGDHKGRPRGHAEAQHPPGLLPGDFPLLQQQGDAPGPCRVTP